MLDKLHQYEALLTNIPFNVPYNTPRFAVPMHETVQLKLMGRSSAFLRIRFFLPFLSQMLKQKTPLEIRIRV